MIAFAVQRVAVDVFCNVFGDIARRTAFVQVLAVKPVFGGAAVQIDGVTNDT